MDDRDGWVRGWGADLVPPWVREAGGDDDGDAAFDNSSHVPGADALLQDIATRSAATRAALGPRARLGLAYGAHPRERLDLFLPEGAPRGVLVFLHGGYWQMSDRSAWSVLAEGVLAHGWAAVLPSYPLAPDAALPRITRSAAAAVCHAASLVPGPMVICGHSAGGHLAARIACADTPLPGLDAARIARVVPISGLHDLRPLRQAHRMNEVLRLDARTAAAESPALRPLRRAVPVRAWVGGSERPELLRQSSMLARAWAPDCTLHVAKGQDHFSIVTGLSDPKSSLTANLLCENRQF